MAGYRLNRINDEVLKELSEVIREIKDPRVRDAFVSITAVDVTPDLKYAKVFYSSLSGDEKEVQKGIDSSSGFVRKQIAQRLNLRVTPEFKFVRDKSIEKGVEVSKLIKQIEKELSEKEEEEEI